ncbi:tyrosine-type recombinase/integrase [Paenarthrobacter sp. YJN-5]|uniref:tyrosine-type recombinase/integrase n=1 Tax=Paenarthrobacter sp. YJN-5 TaxID=2735316 RepID=UPI001877FD27|nr:tyrosine-type recombinase/integrase [Paenarthrobacter sp. YJN-5]QOT19751.1 tyrosine-type recombinase/integrase [Paenarthrobacter sp. YJN-5]
MDTVTAESVLTIWGVWQAAANLSQRTINERTAVIRHLLTFSQCGPYELTPEHIVLYTTRPGLKDSTRATYHSTITAYGDWLVKTGRCKRNPAHQAPSPKRRRGLPRPVKDDDLPHILEAANRRRTRMMILLGVLAGLRVHEIAKFAGEDIDWDNLSMVVTGKGGKTAYLPLHPILAEEAVHFPREGAWFPAYGRTGTIGARAVSKAIKSAMNRAGVKGKPHMLRHHFGTTLLRNGANLRVVQELMRHESIATTQIYTQVTTNEMREAVNSLTPTSPTHTLAA